MCVCVCVCVCVCACVASVAQLVRELNLENSDIKNAEFACSRTSTDVIFMGKIFVHNNELYS